MLSRLHRVIPVSGFARIILIVSLIYGTVLIRTYNSKLRELRANSHYISYVNNKDIKYILQWTRRFSAPFDFLGEGNSAFIKNNCAYNNCFVTDDSNYFLSHSEFDAIAFNGRDIEYLWLLPTDRSPKQKYIFGAMESPDNFPVCDQSYDGFFNWTWTYRLDSDFRFGYITIFDLNGTVVGPAVDMKWPKQLDPISDELKKTLSTKTKASAWFVSRCNSKGKRENFINAVQEELKSFGLSIDIYGSCGSFSCPKTDAGACFELIKKDYYFYFSFENSFSEDYVTEKLLTALNNDAIPVVFGAADYTSPAFRMLCSNRVHGKIRCRCLSVRQLINHLPPMVSKFSGIEFRMHKEFTNSILSSHSAVTNMGFYIVYEFLPPGSYLDAIQLGPKALAEKMNEIISNKTMFYDYFRWRNHYVYRETSSKEDICKLCEMMNNKEKVYETSEWPDLRTWWNGDRYENNCKS